LVLQRERVNLNPCGKRGGARGIVLFKAQVVV
jgi:hypothetical protein